MSEPLSNGGENVNHWSVLLKGGFAELEQREGDQVHDKTVIASMIVDVLRHHFWHPLLIMMARRNESVKQVKCESLMELVWRMVAQSRPVASKNTWGKARRAKGAVKRCLWRLSCQGLQTRLEPVGRTQMWWYCLSMIEKTPIMGLVRGTLTTGWEIGCHSRRSW